MKSLRITVLSVICFLLSLISRAEEGMWLPLFLQQLNEKEMRSMGMKITAKDIYSINQGSLKDAIVSFGGFCTGEVISQQGLVLTNHHCGFDVIQNHSSIQRNYIRDGFWAMDKSQELANPGLFVTFIIRIEEVTKDVLQGVTKELTTSARQALITKNSAAAQQKLKKEKYQDSFIRPFFEGNRYFLFVTETYNDVRLVGAPPSSIGNFGKDTDNWMWPRHTGDFSLFRIYANKDNKPAAYSPDNIPYVPKKSLNISLSGVKEGDFTMVFGFPGRTTQYLPSSAVQQIMEVNDPTKIKIRATALSILDSFMRRNEEVKIKYAAKYANIQNAYKKWQGEVLGLTSTNALDKKLRLEEEFLKRVNQQSVWKENYSTLLQQLKDKYTSYEALGRARDYFNETFPRIETFTILNTISTLEKELNASQKINKESLQPVIEKLEEIFKEFDPLVDQCLFEGMMENYFKDQPEEMISPEVLKKIKLSNYDFKNIANELYGVSGLFLYKEKLIQELKERPETVVRSVADNELRKLQLSLQRHFVMAVNNPATLLLQEIATLQREYMEAQTVVFPEKRFYPDANSTLRVTYGKADGYQPRDGVEYGMHTYLDGVMEKYKPGDYEFDVPEKLRTLFSSKDYGPYGASGKMPVCFIARNHTTGGNSGSPALDGSGNLVGLNFDRVWEGTMSDINYDPTICRNIMVDIRYVLFIIDKFAGAGHLVKEMKLVRP
jgi:hypothetical protein